MKSTHWRGISFLVLSLCLLLSGCAAVQKAKSAIAERFGGGGAQQLIKPGQITVEELGQLTYGFADRYMTLIADACERIERDNPDREQRRRSHQVKLQQIGSTYDIVTNADPFTQLLDLALVVTIQSMKWIDEDQAEEYFGERGQYLILASRKAREDIWKIATRVMKPEQLETLDYLIWDWRRRNDDVEMVSFVRFDDFAASRGKSVVADVKTGSGLLAPVDEAKKAVDEVRLLAERAFYLGKRLPYMINWQVQTAMDNVVGDVPIESLANSVATVSVSADRVSKSIERLPDDIRQTRAEILRDIDARQPMLHDMFQRYRIAVADTTQLSGSIMNVVDTSNELLRTLNTTLGTYDKVFVEPEKGKPKPPNQKPFDIESYAKTAMALTETLREANRLMASTGGMLGPQLQQPIQQISSVATTQVEQATNRGAKLIDQLFWRGVALIIVFFVALFIYRLLTSGMLPAASGAARSAPAAPAALAPGTPSQGILARIKSKLK